MTDRSHILECVCFGVPFRLSAPSEELLVRMEHCSPFKAEIRVAHGCDCKQFALGGGLQNDRYRLLIDDRLALDEGSLLQTLDQLTSEVMVHVAENAVNLVFVHAGVVGWCGRALILPGTSFAGKTTLVAELVRQGATYYSDEYAVLDQHGFVHPYARDLQVRKTDRAEQRSVPVEQLGGKAGAAAIPVAHVIFSEYAAGGCWRPEPVSAGRAALDMMRHAIPVQRAPVQVMATLAKVMENASAVRSERGEASETARLLLESMVGHGATV